MIFLPGKGWCLVFLADGEAYVYWSIQFSMEIALLSFLPSLRAWSLFSNFSANISKQETVITVYYTLAES